MNGFVTSSDDLPISGATVHVYKHMGLIGSADKNPGYSTSVITESDGSYSFNDLPSGVYKFTITHSDDVVQTIDNYAVWPTQVLHMSLMSNKMLHTTNDQTTYVIRAGSDISISGSIFGRFINRLDVHSYVF